jgi:SAM-dependent methyltransferase
MAGESLERSSAAYYADARHSRVRQGTGGQSVGGEFADWVLDLVGPAGFASVLDAGAGVGRFTTRLAERVTAGATITAVDLFPSMVAVLRSLRHRTDVEVRVVRADIGHLPFASGTFDLVMANHVLYHVPDLPGTLAGLAGVMASDGLFVATTNADNAVVPVLELHRQVCLRLGTDELPDASPFSSETAGSTLRQHFGSVLEHEFVRAAAPTTALEVMQSYRSTGRYQLLSQRHSARELDRVGGRILDQWAGRAGAIVGEVCMRAFLCRTDPSRP